MSVRPGSQPLARRIDALPWSGVEGELAELGYARLPGLLEPDECAALIASFGDEARFRKTIEMGGHAYGEGRYRYFDYPLPELVETLRERLYPHLLAVARIWGEQLKLPAELPRSQSELLARCRAAGQTRATPLLLQYEKDGYNRMHQDIYGDVSFPLQVACLLSSPDDFEGGEFLVSESRARMQTRTEAVPLRRGEGIVFANDVRPVASKRGHARATMRHGLSRVRSGERYALGVIFHDAR